MILEHNGNVRGAERKNKFYRREGKESFFRGQKFCCGRKILSAVKGKIRRYRTAREMRDRAAWGVRKKEMRKFRFRGRRTLPHGERRRAKLRGARRARQRRREAAASATGRENLCGETGNLSGASEKSGSFFLRPI